MQKGKEEMMYYILMSKKFFKKLKTHFARRVQIGNIIQVNL